MPPDSDKDREIERRRYDDRARQIIRAHPKLLGPDGADSVPQELRAPYEMFEKTIRTLSGPGIRILDVCCGDGVFSLVGAKVGAAATATDISEDSLKVVQARAHRAGIDITTLTSDAEHLPFPDGYFDVITCTGGLSYVDLAAFLKELRRLLRSGGHFVCVDSLNHNPIYRANRYMHFLRRRRTRSTLARMPTRQTLETIKTHFRTVEVSYYGIFSFLAPVCRLALPAALTRNILKHLDQFFRPLRLWSFKFVLVARKA